MSSEFAAPHNDSLQARLPGSGRRTTRVAASAQGQRRCRSHPHLLFFFRSSQFKGCKKLDFRCISTPVPLQKRRTLSFFTGAFKVGDKIASSFKDVRRNMEPNETQTSGGCPTNQCLSNHLGLIMFSIMQNKTLLKLVPGCSLC